MDQRLASSDDKIDEVDKKLSDKINTLADTVSKLTGTVNTIGVALVLLVTILTIVKALPGVFDGAAQ